MQWIELTIKTAPAAIDLVCDRLTVLGFDSFIIDDQEQFHEFLEQNRQYWDYVDEDLEKQMQGLSQIRLYLEQNASVPETVESLKSQLAALRVQYPTVDFGSLDVQLANVKDEDWENNWKQYYKPFNVGERLYVCPSWETPQLPQGRVQLTMDPASSFGTGSHATTRMCMEQLDALDLGGARVLDVGCGSGILACTALLLGARHALACDIEENAMRVTSEKMDKNGLSGLRYSTRCGDLLSDEKLREEIAANGPYDVILANIVADVLLAMSPYLPKMLAAGGHLILSGIIDTRAEEVRRTFREAGMVIVNEIARDGWVMLCCMNGKA